MTCWATAVRACADPGSLPQLSSYPDVVLVKFDLQRGRQRFAFCPASVAERLCTHSARSHGLGRTTNPTNTPEPCTLNPRVCA